MSSFVSWTTWACLHPRCSIRQCQQTSRWACMSRQVVYIGMREYIGMQGSSTDQICRVKSQSDCVYLGRQGRMRAAHNVCGQGTSRMCVRLCWRDLLYREERGQAGVPTVYQGGGRAGGQAACRKRQWQQQLQWRPTHLHGMGRPPGDSSAPSSC